jgi:hypothetical protein
MAITIRLVNATIKEVRERQPYNNMLPPCDLFRGVFLLGVVAIDRASFIGDCVWSPGGRIHAGFPPEPSVYKVSRNTTHRFSILPPNKRSRVSGTRTQKMVYYVAIGWYVLRSSCTRLEELRALFVGSLRSHFRALDLGWLVFRKVEV